MNINLGTEWVIDANGCSDVALADLAQIQTVFARVINELQLHVIGEIAWHQFSSTGGISGLALLSESHLSCHTYPEFGAATFNLYCCRERASWSWEASLKEMLGAKQVTVRVLERIVKQDLQKSDELLTPVG
jgi:S-adenosylmethionine decarboxylase